MLALIDHQPFVAFPVQSITPTELTNNTVALAMTAQALGVPTVLTTISAEGGPLRDPLFVEISGLFPDVRPIDRNNTSAWSDRHFVEAIEATGRTKLVVAGLWTEVCVAQTVVSAMRAGYEVYVVADACGGVSIEAHERAMQRMIQAGAIPITWQAVMAELCPDNSAPEYQRLYPIEIEHGQGVSFAVSTCLPTCPQAATDNANRTTCRENGPHHRRYRPGGLGGGPSGCRR